MRTWKLLLCKGFGCGSEFEIPVRTAVFFVHEAGRGGEDFGGEIVRSSEVRGGGPALAERFAKRRTVEGKIDQKIGVGALGAVIGLLAGWLEGAFNEGGVEAEQK